jgi:hypothetical protein
MFIKFYPWQFYNNFDIVKKALIQLHIAIFLAGFTAVIGKILENLNEVFLYGTG